MRKLLTLVTLCVLCGIVISCKTIDCDPFPNVHFFSYEESQTYLFHNSNEDVTFTVTNFWKSEAWSFKSNCDCDCDPSTAKVRIENKKISIDGRCELHDFEKAFRFSYKVYHTETINTFDFFIANVTDVDTTITNNDNPVFKWMKFSSEKGFYGFGNDTVQYMLKEFVIKK